MIRIHNPVDTSKEHSFPEHVGGLSRYFVRYRQISWLLLIGTLVSGWLAYNHLPQQEDPTFPKRVASIVTFFPGANASTIENLVTRKLESKLSELDSVDKVESTSRSGASIIYLNLNSQPQWRLNQLWEQARAKLSEVTLPNGCAPPILNSDYGNTTTLVLALTSNTISEAEVQARAQLVISRRNELRNQAYYNKTALDPLQKTDSKKIQGSILIFYPNSIPLSTREIDRRELNKCIKETGVSKDVYWSVNQSFTLIDFVTEENEARKKIQEAIQKYQLTKIGTDGEISPDAWQPIILIGNENPASAIRARALPQYSLREMEKKMEDLQHTLDQVSTVGKTAITGNVPEVVYLRFTPSSMGGYGLQMNQIANAISARNQLVAGGSIAATGRNFPVQFSGEYQSEDELRQTVIGSDSNGLPIYVRDIFEVERGYQNPVEFQVQVLNREKGKENLVQHRAIILTVEMKNGEIISQFDKQVHTALQKFESRFLPGMQLVSLSSQPQAVDERIHHLIHAFFEALIVVLIMCLLLMEWRSACIVAIGIPLTLSLTLTAMWMFGIPIHQISIAGLIISLGMLVDDPVVAADGINRSISAGYPRSIAAWLGPWQLHRAILFGTMINIFAFLPMVLLPGDEGAFIYALPMVVTFSLVASRIVSMTFMPLLGYYILRGQSNLGKGAKLRSVIPFKWIDEFLNFIILPTYKRILISALKRPYIAILIAVILFVAALFQVPYLKQQFFPSADRNQFVINVRLPQAASVIQTNKIVKQLNSVLKKQPEIKSVGCFIGGSTPRFYYNISLAESAPNYAQFLVNTYDAKDTVPVIERLSKQFDSTIAGAQVVVSPLQQGPPLGEPIQIRVSGNDRNKLRLVADQVSSILRESGGYKVYDDLGQLIPNVRLQIDQDQANTLQVTNDNIAKLASLAFTGLQVTQIREQDHLIPVEFNLDPSERASLTKIQGYYVESSNPKLGSLPISAFSTLELDPQYPELLRYNQLETVTVKAYAPFKQLPSEILEKASKSIDQIHLPAGVTLTYGSESEKSKETSNHMLMVMALSLSLISLSMVIQFRSLIKALAVILVMPMGLVGALTGLHIMNAPVGFMAFIGIISLFGVIVSHIIVLSDFIEEACAEGCPWTVALMKAGQMRLRAVLTTTLSTVLALIPLAVSGGTLWYPLTAVHIFGLLFATMITMILLPVIYFVFAVKWKIISDELPEQIDK